jgi:hypothetical protein
MRNIRLPVQLINEYLSNNLHMWACRRMAVAQAGKGTL